MTWYTLIIKGGCMAYYHDLSTITIEAYKDKLKKKTLIPSQMILLEKLDERLDYLKSMGIKNVSELEKLLKDKTQVEVLKEIDCLDEKYLSVLLREIKGRQPKPRRLKDFTFLSTELIEKLENLKLKTTAKLYDHIDTEEKRKMLAEKIGVSYDEILVLAMLTDLTRIQWVNTTFSYVLYEAGYTTIDKVQKADHVKLYNEIKALNEERQIYKGHIGLNDMKICIEAANEVEDGLEFYTVEV